MTSEMIISDLLSASKYLEMHYKNTCSKVIRMCKTTAQFVKLKQMQVDGLQAEIERLNDELEKLRCSYDCELAYRKELHKRAKAEAIKEFAERLKKKKHECGCNYRKKPVYAVTEEKIDETYEEMVGDAE